MALVFFSGFETGDFGEWDSVTNSPTVQGTTKKTGDYGMECDTTGGATTAYVRAGQDIIRVNLNLNIDTAPSSDCTIIKGKYTYIQLTTDRYLKLYDSSSVPGTLIGTSSQLSLATDYVVCMATTTSDPWLAKVYINGSEEISGNAVDSIGLPADAIGIHTSVTAKLYFDDITIDDSSSTADLGDIRVLRSSPNAAGQYAEFDTISGYTYCDEVPADGATTIVDDSGVSTIHRETYNLQNCATIGVGASDTIKAVNVWVQAYSSNVAQGITVRDDGTDYETMCEFGKAYTWKNKLYDVNAPRASAWTPAIFDAFQSGGYSEGSKDVYMSCVMDMVAYTPVGVTDTHIDLSPGLTASATVAYLVAYDRGMSPGLTISATVLKGWGRAITTSPGLTVAVTILKGWGRKITTSPGLTVSATVAYLVAYKRAVTANITTAVTILKGWGRKITTTAAGLTASATIAVKKGFNKSLSPGLTVSATVAKSFGKKIAVTSNLTISATVAYLVAYKRAVQAGLSIAVTIVKSLGKTITTSPGLSVSVSIVKSLARIITMSPGLTISITISVAHTVVTQLKRSWGIIFG